MDGHSTVAGYIINGNKVILAALYGPSCNDDNLAAEVLRGVEDIMGELGQLLGTRNFIMAGDFNIKLQSRRRQNKPRAVSVLKEIMQRFELLDMGEEGNAPTWRRPHLPGSNSRIDYILHSKELTALNYVTAWGRFDHAEILGHFQFGNKRDHVKILKDWALLTPEFLEDAPKLLQNVLLDHDQVQRRSSNEERERFTQGRLPRAYEAELVCSEKEEGITNAHVLVIALGKLAKLQGQVQKSYVTRRRKKLEGMHQVLGNLYEDLDRADPGSEEQGELTDRLEELKTQLKDDAEQVEKASRIRLDNFYMDNNGKNRASSFSITREPRHKQEVGKLIEEDGGEVTSPEGILNRLEGKFRTTVGELFVPEMGLNEFLEKYDVELPHLSDELRETMDEEFTVQEIRAALSSAKAGAAPGPSGQTSAIFKYLLAEVPNLLVKALNELTYLYQGSLEHLYLNGCLPGPLNIYPSLASAQTGWAT
jgi:hypothetical protein